MSDPDSSPEKEPIFETGGEEIPLLTLEDLEKEIQSSDPEFNSSLQELNAIKSSELDASLAIDESQPTLKMEKIKWEGRQDHWRFVKIVFPGVVYLTFAYIWIQFKVKDRIHDLRVQWTYHRSKLGPQLLANIKTNIPLWLGKLKKPFQSFAALEKSQKLSIFGFFIFTLLAISSTVWFLKTDLLKESKDPFLLSMEELSSEKYLYSPTDSMESFYASARVSQNVLAFPKIIANIQRSRNSESNPMIATEVYFEGFSPEVMLELKEREAEIKDLIINIASSTDYNTLITVEGKRNFLEKIQQKVNGLLTEGQIQKIYIKNFIIKP